MKALDYAVRAGYLAVKKTSAGNVLLTTDPTRVLCDGNPHVLAVTSQQVRECLATTNVADLVNSHRIAVVFEAQECQ